jgi:mRNA-degrading endonuclease RelE of RelBE toxin-antitoxin system
MRYQFVFTDWFNHNLKVLGKHNPALRSEIEAFLTSFDAEDNPVIPRTSGARKARMRAKGRGKRSGYHVIYYLALADTVWLITIYDKVQKEDLTSIEIAQIAELVQAIRTGDSAA